MLKILFFGRLEEIVGVGELGWEWRQGMSVGELMVEVRAKYEGLGVEVYRLAVNARFVVGEEELKEGDEVAFMPAFSGG